MATERKKQQDRERMQAKRQAEKERLWLLERIAYQHESLAWRPIDENTPRDPDIEIMLYYREWCGATDFIVSGHWHSQEGREYEATWEHSCGFGDADMWAPMRPAPATTGRWLLGDGEVGLIVENL